MRKETLDKIKTSLQKKRKLCSIDENIEADLDDVAGLLAEKLGMLSEFALMGGRELTADEIAATADLYRSVVSYLNMFTQDQNQNK